MKRAFKEIVKKMGTDPVLLEKIKAAGFKYDPPQGEAPLWFLGDWHTPEKIKALIILDQPGHLNKSRYEDEIYPQDCEERFYKTALDAQEAEAFLTLRHIGRPFFKHLLEFIMVTVFSFKRDHNYRYSPKEYQHAFSQIAVTNSFWFRKQEEVLEPPKEVENYFSENFLKPMINCFPNAKIFSAGERANKRLKKIDIEYIPTGCFSIRGYNHRNNQPKRAEAVKLLRTVLNLNNYETL